MNDFEISKFDIDVLSNYEFNIEFIELFIEDFVKVLNKNRNIFEEILKIDLKYYKNEITFEKIIEIIERYKEYTNVSLIQKNKLVLINGNPELVVNLCFQALFLHTQTVIIINDYMKGINEFIVKCFNTVLDKYNIFNLLFIYNKILNSDIKRIKNMFDEIISIGISSIKQFLYNDVTFYPYNNIGIYCSCSKLEELKQEILDYAHNNKYELELYLYENGEENGNNSIVKVIDQIKNDDYKNKLVVLTSNTQEIKTLYAISFKQMIYINRSPFMDEETIVDYL